MRTVSSLLLGSLGDIDYEAVEAGSPFVAPIVSARLCCVPLVLLCAFGCRTVIVRCRR